MSCDYVNKSSAEFDPGPVVEVDQVYVHRLAIGEAKANSPVPRDAYTPEAALTPS